jgi:hypothetical protein
MSRPAIPALSFSGPLPGGQSSAINCGGCACTAIDHAACDGDHPAGTHWQGRQKAPFNGMMLNALPAMASL